MASNCKHYFVDEGFGSMCRECGIDPKDASQPLLLVGGPWDLDGTEIPDPFKSIVTVKDFDGVDQVYYVMRDWELDRWVGKWQNTRKVATT